MKRFYKTATAAARPDGTASVLLDGRPLKTPAKAEMVLPTLALAMAIAAEWSAQEGEIRPAQMRLTRLAATAIDLVGVNPAPTAADVIRYGGTDLLSYRTEDPAELAARQAAEWQPLLDWFQDRYGIRLNATSGVIAVAQSTELPTRLDRICCDFDAWQLTALHTAVTVTGSVVLGLALLDGRIDADSAYSLSLLDELYQTGLWGEDAEAAARRTDLAEELRSVQQFLLLRSSVG